MPKIFQIELYVSSKLYDLVAQSAKHALWEMGYKDSLSNLQREIYYALDIMAETQEEGEAIAELAVSKTNIFVNPNKDNWRLGRKKQGSIDVLVWYIDEKRGEIIKTSLKNQGFSTIASVFVGEVWHYFGREEAVKDMTEKLLVNPHSQRYKILK